MRQLRTMQPSGGTGWRAGAGWRGFNSFPRPSGSFWPFAGVDPGKKHAYQLPLTSLWVCARVSHFFSGQFLPLFFRSVSGWSLVGREAVCGWLLVSCWAAGL
jgi:hypothetical protein